MIRDLLAGTGTGCKVDDCPISFPYCYQSCFFWSGSKCLYKAFENEMDLRWLERKVKQLKAFAFVEASYGSAEKKSRYMAAVDAYDAVSCLIRIAKLNGRRIKARNTTPQRY